MKIFAEKEAENFLKKEKFEVIETIFIKKKNEIEKAIKKIDFPIVMKVSGKIILHKKAVRGVRINVKNYEQAIKEFDSLMKIKGSEGILIQRQMKGEEFLLGIKSTKEFGHVIAFGIGGSEVERIRKVAFRVYPLNEKEIKEMIKEIEIQITEEKLNVIKKNIIRLCILVNKYPSIKELDINPLFVYGSKAVIADARIIFD
jgi:hypothetical protein